ncbi:MAG: hypothetical protein AAFV53_37415 [Myxococcota bacterium]
MKPPSRQRWLSVCAQLGVIPLPYANNGHGTTEWFADVLTPGAAIDLRTPGFVARGTHGALRLIDAEEGDFVQMAPLLLMTDVCIRARLTTLGVPIPSYLLGGPSAPDIHDPAWVGFISCSPVRSFDAHPALHGRSLVRILGIFSLIAAAIDWMGRGDAADYRYDLGLYGVVWLSFEADGG